VSHSKFVSIVVPALFALICASADAQDTQGTLRRIIASKVIKLGYLKDGVPFSFVIGPEKKPVGYAVDLCQRIVADIQQQLDVPSLAVQWVEVTQTNRFDKVVDGSIDLECGTSTNTVSRQKKVDFSLMTWVDGGNFLMKSDQTMKSLSDLAGKKIAVLGDTTTETTLREALKRNSINAQVVTVKEHLAGLNAMHRGEVDAYAGDQTVLIGLNIAVGEQMPMKLSEQNYSYEPYGLVLRRNDAEFKQVVNQTLARLYRTGEIVEVYDRWFGKLGKPSPLLVTMYALNGLPE